MSMFSLHRLHPALAVFLMLALAGCAGARKTVGPDGWIQLYDGEDLDGWTMAGPGGFEIQPDGSILARGGMGMLYYEEQPFEDFILELDWKVETDSSNSGVFVRFPEKSEDPWYAVNNGYEIQVYDRGDPTHGTGSVYTFSAPFKRASKPAGQWNTYRIQVTGQRYQIWLNGEKINDFFGDRGRTGYIGVQNHDDDSKVWYRNIRVKPLDAAEAAPVERLADLFSAPAGGDPIRVLVLTATHGFRHREAIETSKKVLEELEETTEFEFDLTEDLDELSQENLAQYDLLFFNNSTLRVYPAKQVAGSLANYDITFQTDQGEMRGRIAFSGTREAPTGTISFDAFPGEIPVEELQMRDGGFSFAYNAGQIGRIELDANVERGALEGQMKTSQFTLPITGTRFNASASRDYNAEPLFKERHKQAIMSFLRDGKGIIGAHSAADALYAWDGYRKILGNGLFKAHPWTQMVDIRVEDPNHPAVAHLAPSFSIRDEIYVLDVNPRPYVHVLASLDLSSVDTTGTGQTDVPIAWTREYEGGRVFYTALGHFGDVWTTPAYLQHLLQGMRVTAGRRPAPTVMGTR